MSLIFRIERAKKLPRITVLRKKKQDIKPAIPELIGSFNEQKSFNHITEQLSEPELYEFYNFLSAMSFAKDQFQCQVDDLDRIILKVAPQMKDALYKIWREAQKYGIDFLPNDEMLLAILNRAKVVEQQLKKLTSGQFSALSKLGIDLNEDAYHK